MRTTSFATSTVASGNFDEEATVASLGGGLTYTSMYASRTDWNRTLEGIAFGCINQDGNSVVCL
jgi:hypothetical protein